MKKFLAGLAAGSLVVLGVVIAPGAASAAGGNVTGLITTTTSVGIEDATLEFRSGGSTYYYYTDSTGHIEDFTTLPVGSWTVFIHATGYAPEFYDDSYSIAGATPVTVANPGDPVVINASLAAGSTIEGTVTGPGGTGVANVQVYAFTDNDPTDSTGVARDVTDANGVYSIPSLAPGTYQVWAAPSFGSSLVTEWFDKEYTRDTATPVQLLAPNSTETIDFELAKGGTIEGTVTNSIGSPIDKVQLVATGALGASGMTYPEHSGDYAIPGLLPDDYTLVGTDYSGFFQPIGATGIGVTAANASTRDFVVTPTLVDESEFTNAITPISGPTTVEAGKTYTWTVDVGADSDVYAILYSAPVYLGAAVQDPDGTATITLTIPTTTTPGTHKLTFSSYFEEFSGEARDYFDITVTAAKLPNMGVDLTAPLAGGALLLLVGAGLWMTRRRVAR